MTCWATNHKWRFAQTGSALIELTGTMLRLVGAWLYIYHELITLLSFFYSVALIGLGINMEIFFYRLFHDHPFNTQKKMLSNSNITIFLTSYLNIDIATILR